MMRLSALGLLWSAVVAGQFHSPRAGTVEAGAPRKPSTVSISGFKFSPAEITVSHGDTVVWQNEDSFVHTTAADSGRWQSGELQRGQRFHFVADKPGRYPYHCAAHPVMRGVVIVRQ